MSTRGSVVDRVALRLWRPSRFGPSVGVDERDRARIMVGSVGGARRGGAATYVSGFCRGLIDGDIPHKDQIVVVIDSRWAEVNTDLVEEMQGRRCGRFRPHLSGAGYLEGPTGPGSDPGPGRQGDGSSGPLSSLAR
jgi:hypothetical protein